METSPVSRTGAVSGNPGDYLLPIRYVQEQGSLPPVCVEWWMWFPGNSPTELPMWKRVTAVGV